MIVLDEYINKLEYLRKEFGGDIPCVALGSLGNGDYVIEQIDLPEILTGKNLEFMHTYNNIGREIEQNDVFLITGRVK